MSGLQAHRSGQSDTHSLAAGPPTTRLVSHFLQTFTSHLPILPLLFSFTLSISFFPEPSFILQLPSSILNPSPLYEICNIYLVWVSPYESVCVYQLNKMWSWTHTPQQEFPRGVIHISQCPSDDRSGPCADGLQTWFVRSWDQNKWVGPEMLLKN